MAKKSIRSRLPEEEPISQDELIDYDGRPTTAPISVTLTNKDDIDATTCLFPFAVKVDPSARFPKGLRYVPCGHCEDCMRRKRNQWFFRIKQEARSHLLNLFVTLTYDDDHLVYDDNGNPCVFKEEIRQFMRRLRKEIYPNKVRYYGISEYGPTTFRPHYHIVLFNWPVGYDQYSILLKTWGKGNNITVSILQDEQAMYVCRYHTDKGFTPYGFQPTFTFMSKQPGIGACYADDPDVRNYYLNDPERALSAPLEGGKRTSLGRYLRHRIYGKEFECPAPPDDGRDNLSRGERLRTYYAKKAKRRAKLNGKL
ncbi:hypothetical protein LJC45_02920 [Alistipes sp. OttesenSCG-928-B03]|nr:hypothetical protein [Alistipes sp. OttesenSCG-928-B03]